MPNPFTLESRDAVLSLNITGLLTRLRSPESIRRLLMEHKPQHLSTSDFALKALYDAVLIRMIVDGRYRELQATLEHDFGRLDHNGDSAAKAARR